MKCPKCGFENSGDSCPRCGVVFSKLSGASLARPSRNSRPYSPSPASGLLNVVVLGCVILLAGMIGWYFWNRMDANPPPPVPSNGAPSVDRFQFDGTRENRERKSSVPAEPLLLERLAAQEPVNPGPPGSVPEAPSAPSLPSFNTQTISPELVEEIVRLARQYPHDRMASRAAGLAHLVLASRRFSEGRYREALQLVGDSEAWDPPPREAALLKAHAYLQIQDLSHAREWAQAALAFGPDADMYDVLGQVHYLREEMADAVEAWKHALELGENPRIRAFLEKALREIEVADRYDRQRLSHFIVRYEGDKMESTGRMVLDSLERSYAFLKSSLGFEPGEPVVVILYPRQDYAELGGPHWSAGLFDGKVRVPVRGLVSLDQPIESTLRHELTHAFLYARAGMNCPRWLHEGVAEYCEGRGAEEFGRMLAEKIRSDGNFVYCLMEERCDVRYFYPAAASLVQYMLQNRGMGGLRDLLSHLGGGEPIDSALHTVYGRDEMALIMDWQHFIKRRY